MFVAEGPEASDGSFLLAASVAPTTSTPKKVSKEAVLRK